MVKLTKKVRKLELSFISLASWQSSFYQVPASIAGNNFTDFLNMTWGLVTPACNC